MVCQWEGAHDGPAPTLSPQTRSKRRDIPPGSRRLSREPAAKTWVQCWSVGATGEAGGRGPSRGRLPGMEAWLCGALPSLFSSLACSPHLHTVGTFLAHTSPAGRLVQRNPTLPKISLTGGLRVAYHQDHPQNLRANSNTRAHVWTNQRQACHFRGPRSANHTSAIVYPPSCRLQLCFSEVRGNIIYWHLQSAYYVLDVLCSILSTSILKGLVQLW